MRAARCVCGHEQGVHKDGRRKCAAKGCDCPTFDKNPYSCDEPGTWLDHDDDAWKQNA